ncbi:MAG TPA: hypothetical protein VKR56_12410 [Candidatus Cybelea sp.]|nr:hypothetical protein [Candidatus Cybelea sp.]
MRSLNVTVELLADQFHHAFWSSEPHRRVELDIIFSNDGDKVAVLVSYEVMLPEDAVLDFSADSWKPSHRHLVDGTTYVVWSTHNAASAQSGQGYTVSPHASGKEKLTVDLRPYVAPLVVLWRAFEGEAEYPPDGFGRQEIPLRPYAPSL